MIEDMRIKPPENQLSYGFLDIYSERSFRCIDNYVSTAGHISLSQCARY